MTALVVGAFAAGALTGINLPRAANAASHLDATARSTTGSRTFAGVASNNMSDAVREALYGSTTWFAGVADNNMSDAADRARFGSK